MDGISSIPAILHTPQILRCAQSMRTPGFSLTGAEHRLETKIEGNMESSNSAIQFSVFVFGIVRRIRRSRGRRLEHLRTTLRARALVFQRSAGIEYSKLLFPILLHGIATLIFNLWSSYRSIDKKRCVTKRWQFRENSSHSQDMFILRCSSTCNRGALTFHLCGIQGALLWQQKT